MMGGESEGCARFVVGVPAALIFGFGVNVLVSGTPELELPKAYADMYNTYVEQTIKTEQEKIHRVDWNKIHRQVDRDNQR